MTGNKIETFLEDIKEWGCTTEGLAFIMMVCIALVGLCYASRGFLVKDKTAMEIVAAQGYLETKILSRSSFLVKASSCVDQAHNAASFVFQAKEDGKPVTLLVCCDLFGGANSCGIQVDQN